MAHLTAEDSGTTTAWWAYALMPFWWSFVFVSVVLFVLLKEQQSIFTKGLDQFPMRRELLLIVLQGVRIIVVVAAYRWIGWLGVLICLPVVWAGLSTSVDWLNVAGGKR